MSVASPEPSEPARRVQRIYRVGSFPNDHETVLGDGPHPRTKDLTVLCLPPGAPEPTR